MDRKQRFRQLLPLLTFVFVFAITLCLVHGFNSYYKGQPEGKSPGKIPKEKDNETLILTNVIVRHGDRIPDKVTIYPNDPYANVSYFPNNLGELNQKGQARLFNVGKNLRERYGSFLGEIFYSDLVSSTASSYFRTQMSLQALHAGLFYANKCNPVSGFPWQPVPYTIIPFADDKFIAVHKRCRQVLNVTPPERTDRMVQEIYDYVQLHSGYDRVTYMEILYITDNILSVLDNGFAIPEWVKPIYPEPLVSLNLQFWKTVQKENKRIGAGFLLKKITEDAIAKATGTLHPKNRKMNLYCGHDLNIHLMRGALNVWTLEPVGYGAYILLELHKINGEFGFKIYYNNNYDVPQLLRVPGCEYFCPLDQFIALTRSVYDPEPRCE